MSMVRMKCWEITNNNFDTNLVRRSDSLAPSPPHGRCVAKTCQSWVLYGPTPLCKGGARWTTCVPGALQSTPGHLCVYVHKHHCPVDPVGVAICGCVHCGCCRLTHEMCAQRISSSSMRRHHGERQHINISPSQSYIHNSYVCTPTPHATAGNAVCNAPPQMQPTPPFAARVVPFSPSQTPTTLQCLECASHAHHLCTTTSPQPPHL